MQIFYASYSIQVYFDAHEKKKVLQFNTALDMHLHDLHP